MACEETQENLVALLQHELSAGEERAVQGHLDGCAVCREELEGLRGVFKSAKRINMIEPSAAFRKNLERRIAEAIEHTKRQKKNKRPGTTAVRLPPVTVNPEPDPVTPVQIVPLREAQPGRRTARMSLRRAPEPRGPWLRYLASAAAVVLLALGIAHLTFFPRHDVPLVDQAQLEAEKRWNERREAPNWEKLLSENALALPDEVSVDGPLYLLGHNMPKYQEHCVFAYTEADFEAMRQAVTEPEAKEQVEQLYEKAVKVAVDAGRLSTPYLAARLGGKGARVTILRLSGRIEIWSSAHWERYRRAAPVIETIPVDQGAEDSALPPHSDLPGLRQPSA